MRALISPLKGLMKFCKALGALEAALKTSQDLNALTSQELLKAAPKCSLPHGADHPFKGLLRLLGACSSL